MELKYLGTAAAEGWPGIYCKCDFCEQAKAKGGKNIRTRSQAVIDDFLLIDLPPDTYMHMLQDGLKMPLIEHVLITHSHQDHFYPEDLLFRCNGFAHGITAPLTIYGNPTVINKLNVYRKSMSVQEKNLQTRIRWIELKPFETTQINQYRITPLLASHDPAETCFIYSIEKNGKSILYANDTGFFPEETWEYLQDYNPNMVSLDCTMGRFSEGTNHLGVPDVLTLKERMLQTGMADLNTKFIATHFSHNGQLLHDDLVKILHPIQVLVAYDGFCVSV